MYPLLNRPGNAEVSPYQWIRQKVEREGKNPSQITVNAEVKMTQEELVDRFQSSLSEFLRHLFNIRWQYRIHRSTKRSPTSASYILTSAIVTHVDIQL